MKTLLAILLLSVSFTAVSKEKRVYETTVDYYNCEFLNYCPDSAGNHVPEMWHTVKCYLHMGKGDPRTCPGVAKKTKPK